MGGLAELGKLGIRPASALVAPLEGLSTDRAIPVLPMLARLLPFRGLPRGSTIALGGVGATSLLFALLAEATTRGSWAALVGLPGLGLAAAQAIGVALERVALVPEPGVDTVATVAMLLDGFDLVAVACPGGLSPALSVQLSARARKAGSVLLAMSQWPSPTMSITSRDGQWLTRGRLRCRKLTIRATGRGSAARPSEVQVWLPDDAVFRARTVEPDLTERDVAHGEQTPVRRLRVVS